MLAKTLPEILAVLSVCDPRPDPRGSLGTFELFLPEQPLDKCVQPLSSTRSWHFSLERFSYPPRTVGIDIKLFLNYFYSNCLRTVEFLYQTTL